MVGKNTISRAILCISLLFSAYSTAFASDKPIRLGVITDLSGPAAYFGRNTRIGATIGMQELKAENSDNSLYIDLLFEDSGLNPQRAISAAQKLIQLDKVDALYVDFSSVAAAVAPLVKNANKLLMYSASSELVVEGNQNAFKLFRDVRAGCRSLSEQFKRDGIEKIGILTAEAEYGELCAAGAKQVYSDYLEQGFKPGEMVSSQLLRFKGGKITAIVHMALEGDVRNMLSSSKKINYIPRIGSSKDAITQSVKKEFSQMLEDSLSFGLYTEDKKIDELLKKYAANERGLDPELISVPYIHIQQLAKSINACPKRSVSCIIAKLSSMSSEPLIKFTGFIDRKAKYEQAVYRLNGGNFVSIEQR